MGIQVAKYVGELLYEHDCVIIPGLGGFIANYQEASVDHSQGDILPPSKSLSFNPDLQINDGLLINHITRKEHVVYADARNAVEEFARKCKETLDSGEIMAIQSVGKLYNDIENKLRFIPDSTNFLADSFGLPKVQFFPILRSETQEEKIAIIQETVEKPIPLKQGAKKRAIAWFPIIATAGALALFLLLIPVIRNLTGISSSTNQAGIEKPVKDRNTEKGLAGLVDTGRINDEKGGLDAISEEGNESANELNTADNPDNPITSGDDNIATETHPTEEISPDALSDKEKKSKDESALTPPPSGKEYIIVVGCFGVKANADRLADKISNDGYTVDVGKLGKLNRVGVKVTGSRAMLKEVHQEVKDLYTSSAWVLK